MSLRKAQHNVAIGARMKARLLSFGVTAERLSVIPNWCPDENIRPLDRTSILWRAWDLGGKFVVAYSGNLGRAHEFKTLLGAAECSRTKQSSFFFLSEAARSSHTCKPRSHGEASDIYSDFSPTNPPTLVRLTDPPRCFLGVVAT